MSGVGGPASRPLRDNELNAVINALDMNDDKVLQRNELNIAAASLRNELDTNYNGRFESSEVKAGLHADRFSVSLNRSGAVQVLLKLDSNQDGYLGRNELELNEAAVHLVDGYGSRKYSAENGQLVRDDKNRTRQTGQAAADGRVSISEFANALADGRLVVGQRFALPGRASGF